MSQEKGDALFTILKVKGLANEVGGLKKLKGRARGRLIHQPPSLASTDVPDSSMVSFAGRILGEAINRIIPIFRMKLNGCFMEETAACDFDDREPFEPAMLGKIGSPRESSRAAPRRHSANCPE